MATLERRVQILFDPRRYEELEAEAAAQRMSVGALIREAVDDRMRMRKVERSEALKRLLASADDGPAHGPIDWASEKDAIERDYLRGIE